MFKSIVLNVAMYFLILANFVFAINGDWAGVVNMLAVSVAYYYINYGD